MARIVSKAKKANHVAGLLVILLLVVLQNVPSTQTASSGIYPLSNYQDLENALEQKGLKSEYVQSVRQSFLSINGDVFKVNDANLQVFLCPDDMSAQTEASRISANYATLSGSDPIFEQSLHFYVNGPMLVLYIGNDKQILDALNSLFGPQVAGN